MDLKEFIEKTEPEVLQKLASEAQDEMVNKVIDAIFPLLEKTANYTAQLVLEKIAEELSEKKEPKEEKEEVENTDNPNEESAEQAAVEDENVKIDSTPATGNKTNETMDPTNTPGGMRAQDIKNAVSEACEAGQSNKIIPFVKAVGEQYPDAIQELIKMVKVELQAAFLNKSIDEETATALSDELNAMVGA
jgi:hypothetical protein